MSRLLHAIPLAALALLSGCGQAESGRYVLDRDAMLAKVDPIAGNAMLTTDLLKNMQVELQLADDGTFVYTLSGALEALDLAGEQEYRGRWKAEGQGITLLIAEESGTPVDPPRRWELKAEGQHLELSPQRGREVLLLVRD